MSSITCSRYRTSSDRSTARHVSGRQGSRSTRRQGPRRQATTSLPPPMPATTHDVAPGDFGVAIAKLTRLRGLADASRCTTVPTSPSFSPLSGMSRVSTTLSSSSNISMPTRDSPRASFAESVTSAARGSFTAHRCLMRCISVHTLVLWTWSGIPGRRWPTSGSMAYGSRTPTRSWRISWLSRPRIPIRTRSGM